ncbi:MAG: cytochrome o ubiquinol oxidase subunit IV [Spirochaetales bacterium]
MSHEQVSHATGHSSAGKYMVGFALAIVLTLVSFGLVMFGGLPPVAAILGIVIAAVAQIVVHLYYFLHLDLSKDKQWDFISITFTAIILLIFIFGTVWVIFTLNTRMM